MKPATEGSVQTPLHDLVLQYAKGRCPASCDMCERDLPIMARNERHLIQRGPSLGAQVLSSKCYLLVQEYELNCRHVDVRLGRALWWVLRKRLGAPREIATLVTRQALLAMREERGAGPGSPLVEYLQRRYKWEAPPLDLPDSVDEFHEMLRTEGDWEKCLRFWFYQLHPLLGAFCALPLHWQRVFPLPKPPTVTEVLDGVVHTIYHDRGGREQRFRALILLAKHLARLAQTETLSEEGKTKLESTMRLLGMIK